MILVYKDSIILKKGFTKCPFLLQNITKTAYLLKIIKSIFIIRNERMEDLCASN